MLFPCLVLNMLKYYLKTFYWLINKLFYMFSKTFDIFLIYIVIRCSLFHMKITTSVAKSSHQHCDPCYLHLPIFSSTYTLLLCGKIKSYCDHCFPQQIRPQNTVQLYILQDYSSGRIDFNRNNKPHSLPIVYTMLVYIRKFLVMFYSELNEVRGSYV